MVDAGSGEAERLLEGHRRWRRPLNEVPKVCRTLINNTSYTALATDSLIAYTAVTAARTVTLVALANDQIQEIHDESGQAGPDNITVAALSGQTINGQASVVINTAYGYVCYYYSGSNFSRGSSGGATSGRVTNNRSRVTITLIACSIGPTLPPQP